MSSRLAHERSSYANPVLAQAPLGRNVIVAEITTMNRSPGHAGYSGMFVELRRKETKRGQLLSYRIAYVAFTRNVAFVWSPEPWAVFSRRDDPVWLITAHALSFCPQKSTYMSCQLSGGLFAAHHALALLLLRDSLRRRRTLGLRCLRLLLCFGGQPTHFRGRRRREELDVLGRHVQ